MSYNFYLTILTRFSCPLPALTEIGRSPEGIFEHTSSWRFYPAPVDILITHPLFEMHILWHPFTAFRRVRPDLHKYVLQWHALTQTYQCCHLETVSLLDNLHIVNGACILDRDAYFSFERFVPLPQVLGAAVSSASRMRLRRTEVAWLNRMYSSLSTS